jgi:hypothetical protein
MGDSMDSASVPDSVDDNSGPLVVDHPLPSPKSLKDPHNVWGFDSYVVNSSAPISDGRMSTNQVLSLFSNLFPMSISNFIHIANAVMLHNPSLQTATTMIERAPVYPISYALGRYGFDMVEVPEKVVPFKPEYCAWLLLARVEPRSAKASHKDRKHSNVQHVLFPRAYDGETELQLWTYILVLPTSLTFFTRFANTGKACTPQLHIPLPFEWLRLKLMDGELAEGSFLGDYSMRYKITPNVPLGQPTVVLGTHHSDFAQGTPFVVPDYYLPLSPEEPPLDLRSEDFGLKQTVYRTRLQKATSNRSLCRRYVQGAVFQNPLSTGGVFKITASMLMVGSFDLHVDVLQGDLGHPLTRTCVRVARCLDKELLAAGRKLADTLPSSSSGVRRDSLQYGVMHSFGMHVYNGVLRKFKETAKQAVALLQFTELFSNYLSLSFPFEAAAMTTSERSRGLYPDTSSFAPNSPCASLNASVDLGNADHYDTRDVSIGVSLFLTNDPKCPVSGWFFVLPNIELEWKGICYKGVLIELQDGVALSWDGRHIRHCTSAGVSTAPSNHRFGLHMAANGPAIKLSSPGSVSL